MKTFFKVLSPFIFLISLFAFYFGRTMPSGKLWQNYAVLYVPSKTSDSLVLNAIEQSGIKNYVCLSNQYLPVSLSPYSAEISLFNINKDDDSYSYYKNRDSYFFDRSHSFSLYYIPRTEQSKIQDCMNLLAENKISCATDSSASYPFLLPLILLAAAVILTLFSKNKILFALSSVPVIFFIICSPFFPVATGASMLMICSFFISKLWSRKGLLTVLSRQYYLYLLLILGVTAAFSCGIKTGFLFVLLILCEISFFFCFYEVQNFLRAKKTFVPVSIKPARLISVKDRNSKTSILFLAACSFLIAAVFFLSSSSVSAKFAKILLPANSSSTEQNLPQFEDYYKWMWNIKTAPYRSLNSSSQRNDIVEFPVFNDENGFISESKNIMVYNQSFKDLVFEQIDYLPFNSIEKVMKSEGSDFSGGYKSTESNTTSLFSIILMIISVFVLLFIYFFIMIDSRNKRIRA